jgi:error-prone DNA polymerase
VKGLANAHAAKMIGARAGVPFRSPDDLWCRAGIPAASLVQLAEADAFRPSLGLARREALWALKGLRDEPLPLFAAASRPEDEQITELTEPEMILRPLAAGGEVVEDYVHLGLTLRDHPMRFLRGELTGRKILTCQQAMLAADNKWLETAGLVLVRQKPGSAKGVMFITIEDETGIANLVIWPDLYEKQRRIILSAGMIGVYGRVQREGEVVHLIAHRLTDLSRELASIGERETKLPMSHGERDQTRRGEDLRAHALVKPQDDIFLARGTQTIAVKTRDFR